MTDPTQYLLYQIGRRFVNAVPLRAAYRMAEGLADWQYTFRRHDREMVTSNVRAVLGDHDPAVAQHARAIFRNFGKYLVDFFRMDQLDARSLPEWVAFPQAEQLRQLVAEGRGVIGLTAHIGNWELAGVAIALQGVPITAVALDHLHPKVNALFVARRQRHGVESVSLGHAFRVCLRRLKQGAMVGLLADRNFGDHGVTVPLFGRPALLPRGPAVLSVMTGAPIVPCFMIRRPDDRFTFHLEPPIVSESRVPREEAIRRLTVRYAEVLERYIRQYPGQWCMFRRFWVEGEGS